MFDSRVSESDILGPIDYFSDIKKLVSFERAVLADYSFIYKMKRILFSCLYHHFKIHALSIMNSVYVIYITVLLFYQYISGQLNDMSVQRYDIFISYLKNFDTDTLYPVFVSH